MVFKDTDNNEIKLKLIREKYMGDIVLMELVISGDEIKTDEEIVEIIQRNLDFTIISDLFVMEPGIEKVVLCRRETKTNNNPSLGRPQYFFDIEQEVINEYFGS